MRMMRLPPISTMASTRIRLLLWIVVPQLVIILIILVSTWVNALSVAQDAYDDGLEDSAYALASVIRHGPNASLTLVDSKIVGLFAPREGDMFYYQILNSHGVPLPGHNRNPRIWPPLQLGFADGTVGGHPVRLFAYATPGPRSGPGRIIIRVAETVEHRHQLIASNFLESALPTSIATVLGILVTFWGVRRGLRPLERLSEEVRNRSHESLTPIDEVDRPTEVLPLVRAINGLLASVERTLEHQRHFIERAAHQLRTPLACLCIECDNAATALVDPRAAALLTPLRSSVHRMSHLVHQLLCLARVAPVPSLRDELPRSDLGEVARQVILSLVNKAIMKQHELIVHIPEKPVVVAATSQNLSDVIANLVDNAVEYTPCGGTITVTVHSEPPSLVVSDSGGGIPQDEKGKIFDRFYRSRTATGLGSGLGLAIVKEVLTSIGGTCAVTSPGAGGGADFIITFNGLYG